MWALADEERVLQIGRALVMNALVHTPAGTRIVVRATRKLRPGGARRRGRRARASQPSEREAVFERFYRIEGGKASGSGLGLAIARELARLMNGSVRLESAPGRTVVVLDVPGDGHDEREAAAFSRENGVGSTRDR